MSISRNEAVRKDCGRRLRIEGALAREKVLDVGDEHAEAS